MRDSPMKVRGLGAVLVALGIQSCCGESDEPCASWPQNMTYSLELAEPSDVWPGGNSVEASCGTFLRSDRLSVLPGKLTRDSGGDEGCECIPRHANFMLDGVTELEPKLKPHNGPTLIYSADVELEGGCKGTLELELYQSFASADGGPMDAFFFTRTFRAESRTMDECEAAGLPSATPWCGDSWLANIYDSQGDAVALE